MWKPVNSECPACGSKIGDPCRTLNGNAMLEYHPKRNLAALQKKHPNTSEA